MIVASHLLLAKRIDAYLRTQYNIHLSLGAFERGSVAPDLFAKDKGSHSAELCLLTVGRILDEMKKDDSSAVFSYKLGLAVHFVADYFTLAHNSQELMRDLNRHICYEMRLHYRLMRADGIPTLPLFRGDELLPLLAQRHELYGVESQGCEHDLQCILELCTTLAASVACERRQIAPAGLRVATA